MMTSVRSLKGSRTFYALLITLLLAIGLPMTATAQAPSSVDTSAMTAREREMLKQNKKEGWELVSYSKVKITHAIMESGDQIPIRREVLAGPAAGTVEECSDCMGIQHHNGRGSLSLSVTAYRKYGSGHPSDWLFQGHFMWLDTEDVVNINDDFVSLAWSGNQALEWDELNLYYENGSISANDYYQKDAFPG